MTKLQKLLIEKQMLQSDLIRLIKETQNVEFDKAFLSRIVNGKNMTVGTAKIISNALEVKIDEII